GNSQNSTSQSTTGVFLQTDKRGQLASMLALCSTINSEGSIYHVVRARETGSNNRSSCRR
ncbi:MAG TPA: hypothetical protein V6D35_09165, partial [Candidatus Sericytochromatia bacterium]